MLNEVEIQASWHRSYGTYEEMTLSKQNNEFGTSALDAVSSLPMFRSTIGGEALVSTLGENVSIVIDGRPASAHQLSLLVGSDIKKIRYYKVAPEKYRLLTTGEMIEVTLNKPVEKEYRAGVGLHTGAVDFYTLAYPYFVYSDKKNTFSVEANLLNYRLKPRNREEFRIDNVYNKVNTYKGNSFNHNNSVSIDYQYNGSKDMVYLLIRPKYEINSLNKESLVFSILDGVEADGIRTQDDHSKNRSVYGQFYYTHEFRRDVELSVELSDEVTHSDSRSSLLQDLDMNGYTPVNIFTRNKGNYNDFKGMVAFSFPLFQGKFSATAQYSLLEATNRYVYPGQDKADDTPFYQNQFHQYYAVSWFRMFGKVGTSIQLTAPVSRYHLDNNDRYNSITVLPHLRFFYNPDQQWSLTGSFWLTQNNKPYNTLNNYESWYNPYFVRKNSADQSNFLWFCGQISGAFTSPDRKIYLSANIRSFLSNSLWLSDFEREGNIIIERMVKCRNLRFFQLNLSAAWRPVTWWQLMPTFSYTPIISMKYPGYYYKTNRLMIYIQSIFNYRNFSANLHWRSKFKEGFGLTELEYPMEFCFGMSFRTGGFTFRAIYVFPYASRNKQVIEKESFRYYDLTKYPTERHEVQFQIIYRFKSGEAKNKKSKQNIAIDGINTYKVE